MVNNVIVPKISLTKLETDICNLLKDYTNLYNSANNNENNDKEPLTLRITGGWVRDKLLGQGSHDLDIAINNMTGEQFAVGLNEYLNEHYSKYGIKPHSIHKIDKNPEKSKHLETATTKLFGVEVDFVNLRSEEYTELSRIPVVNFGTPEEDALRRDATLNALFYNIQKDEIEDFTKRGLKDLQNGILRTPLPARQTFLDDPLRVLRLIRFASRFNFKIDDDVITEMKDPEINKAFIAKISRERVGVEMEKILSGPNPLIGIKLIQKTLLENAIFFWCSDTNVLEFNKSHLDDFNKIDEIYSTHKLNGHILKFTSKYYKIVNDNPHLHELIHTDPVFKQNLILSSTLLPLSGFKIVALPKKKINNIASLTESVVKEGLKLSKSDALIVAQCVDNITNYSNILHEFISNGKSIRRSVLGAFIRSFRGFWQNSHYTSLVNEYLKASNEEEENLIVQNYMSLYDHIIKENLQNCHDLKPIIDGKKLQKLLNMKPGPWMGKVNNEVIIWQLDNPSGTQDMLLAYIKEILPQFL